jgi:hypothetical protein
MRQVREKFQDNLAYNDIKTLVYYVNTTARQLSGQLFVSEKAMYASRNNVSNISTFFLACREH